MNPVIQELTPALERQWDEYVLRHEFGSPFHLTAWKNTVQETFGYRPVYLLCLEDGQVRGVLPLFFVKNILIGKALISTPFAVYGGVLAENNQVCEAFLAELKRLGATLGLDYAELRNAHPKLCLGLPTVDRYVTFTQSLDGGPDAIMASIPRKTRRMVRKSLENSLRFTTTRDVTRFFEIYSENLRRLGTPCFPKSLFLSILKNFGDRVDLRMVGLENQSIAGVVNFYFRDQVLPYYAAADPRFNHLAPNNFMYYMLMCEAAEKGIRVFDFGRSKKGSGSFDFKAHWGMTIRDLPYEILLVRRKELPNYSHQNPKFQMAISVWQKIPLPLTRILGPAIVRLVP